MGSSLNKYRIKGNNKDPIENGSKEVKDNNTFSFTLNFEVALAVDKEKSALFLSLSF